MRVVVDLGAEDVIGGHDAVERRDHDFARRGGHDIERELVAFDAARQEFDEGLEAAFQAHAPAGFDEVLAPHAAELGVVPDQVGELAALLHQVAVREARDLVFESGDP